MFQLQTYNQVMKQWRPVNQGTLGNNLDDGPKHEALSPLTILHNIMVLSRLRIVDLETARVFEPTIDLVYKGGESISSHSKGSTTNG